MAKKAKIGSNTQGHFSVSTILLLVVHVIHVVTLFSLLAWGLVKSLQSQKDYVMQGFAVGTWPKEFTLDNFKKAFTVLSVKPTLQYNPQGLTFFLDGLLLNSVLYSIICSCSTVFASAIMGYLTVRIRTRFNHVAMGIYWITLFIPIIGSLPSTLQIMHTSHLFNTWVGMVALKASFTDMTFLMFRAAFEQLSGDFAEAAKIDGAGHVRIMLGIEFPLVKTLLMVFLVQGFINFWNDYQTPMNFLPGHPTAAYGLWSINQYAGFASYVTYRIAAFYIFIIPTLVMFLLFRKRLMGDLTVGGVKG